MSLINKLILDKLDKMYTGDKNTYLAILYSIHVGADTKLLRLCAKELKDLREACLIEQEYAYRKMSLIVPFFQDDCSLSSETGEPLVEKLSEFKEDSIHDWIESWRQLFPRSKNETGLAYLLRGDAMECLRRMKDFVKNYGYSKEMIFDATEYYLREQKSKGWTYTKKAHKFIKDKDGSILSEYCELIESGDYDKSQGDSFINVV